MKPRIPLLLISIKKGSRIGKRFSKFVKPLVTDSLKNNLKKSRLKIKPIDYLNTITVNALTYALLFMSLFSLLFLSQAEAFDIMIVFRGLGTGLAISALLFLILYIYPRIIAGKVGEITDSELLFALNDILVQVRAKIDLYKALVNVVESDYEYVSDELLDVVDEVESGNSMIEALKHLALRTQSEFMKRAAWQLINSLRSGSEAEKVISSLISELEVHYQTLISNYTKELNVLTLIYLTLAVVAPTIGITVLIILSSFGGLALSRELIILVISVLIIVQPIIIGFINSRRPLVKI